MKINQKPFRNNMFVYVLISIEISSQLVEFCENCISKTILGKWRRAVHGKREHRSISTCTETGTAETI